VVYPKYEERLISHGMPPLSSTTKNQHVFSINPLFLIPLLFDNLLSVDHPGKHKIR